MIFCKFEFEVFFPNDCSYSNSNPKLFFELISKINFWFLITVRIRSLLANFYLNSNSKFRLRIRIWIQIQIFVSEYLFDFKFKSSHPNSYLKSNLKFRFRILIWIQSFITETLVKFKVYFPSFYPNKNPERKLPIWLWIKSQRLSFEIE